MLDKGTVKVKLNQCTWQASLKFLFVSHSIRSLNLLVQKEAGVQNAQKHDCTEEYTYVENKLENCICKRIFWFFLTEN
jgi:hypothetical protein